MDHFALAPRSNRAKPFVVSVKGIHLVVVKFGHKYIAAVSAGFTSKTVRRFYELKFQTAVACGRKKTPWKTSGPLATEPTKGYTC
jgi:hypothetical protein